MFVYLTILTNNDYYRYFLFELQCYNIELGKNYLNIGPNTLESFYRMTKNSRSAHFLETRKLKGEKETEEEEADDVVAAVL